LPQRGMQKVVVPAELEDWTSCLIRAWSDGPHNPSFSPEVIEGEDVQCG
jgi:hypothetical protein